MIFILYHYRVQCDSVLSKRDTRGFIAAFTRISVGVVIYVIQNQIYFLQCKLNINERGFSSTKN